MSIYAFTAYRGDECWRCRRKSNLMVVWEVRPREQWDRFDASHAAYPRIMCVNVAGCRARVEKRRDRASTRSSLLVLQEPQAPNAPPGTCCWCGDPIVLIGHPEAYRRKSRAYHRGDKWEMGDRDCRDEQWNSRCWNPRVAVRRRENGYVVCVDCGAVCEGGEPVDGLIQAVPWDADHEVPLEDGGDHSLDNLAARCVECHKAKTAREAAERALRRREARQGQMPLDDAEQAA